MINEGDAWRLYPGPQRQAMEREYESFLDYIKDPELRQKLTPDYNLGCTRIPKSDRNYYQAVQLPNAHIVKGQIDRIEPNGVVMEHATALILRVTHEARSRSASAAPTVAATERFLARLGAAFPGTVWVGGCKNWYTSAQPTPVLWPFPQSAHKEFFDRAPLEDFEF